MAEREGKAELSAGGPIADDMTIHEALADEAARRGLQHRAAGTALFGMRTTCTGTRGAPDCYHPRRYLPHYKGQRTLAPTPG